MPKRTDIHKILIIGSGPIIIGQAAEFDYAGTQACLSLSKEGYEVILCNNNPATIMTDSNIADKIYMWPLTVQSIAEICKIELPDAIIPGMGGQTGLNISMDLYKSGILEELNIELLGTSAECIDLAENRLSFKKMCEEIREPIIPSEIAYDIQQAKYAAERLNFPVVLRPAFTLGGTGGGIANNPNELTLISQNAFKASPTNQALIEKSIRGYKEIEFEVIRDSCSNSIIVCEMENIDPCGVHTGDSIVVAPTLSVNDNMLKILRKSAYKIVNELKIQGGCNIQFAVNHENTKYYLIEVNPRVSRSSALASKASGYPIAQVAAKIAVGMTLDEISVANSKANIMPVLDYIVAKLPRFAFEKFPEADKILGTQMKATGEAMAIGSNLAEALIKGLRSLDTDDDCLFYSKFSKYKTADIYDYLKDFHHDYIGAICELLRRKEPIKKIHTKTSIATVFIEHLAQITEVEKSLHDTTANNDTAILLKAKKLGFSDKQIAKIWNCSEVDVYKKRKKNNILPAFKHVDTMQASAKIPYIYSTYSGKNEIKRSMKNKFLVLGSGPIRIGQGIEFDYSTVHAAQTIRGLGYEAIIVNNNPETVSTDYLTSDKLYFEPLTFEDVMAIIDVEHPEGVIATLGGQTAINLAESLHKAGCKLIGTDFKSIELAEDRDKFHKICTELNIPQPKGRAVTNRDEALKATEEIGYPVLVRPSFVLGGRAMQIINNDEELQEYLYNAFEACPGRPVLIDQYIQGKECEVDAICDGSNVFVPEIIEHFEPAGIHSGDSKAVIPSYSLSNIARNKILKYTALIGKNIGIIGLFNVQFVIDKTDNVYVIDANPRSSRTVPFVSKATGVALADVATEVMLGKTLPELGFDTSLVNMEEPFVKTPVFSFEKLPGANTKLGPEMKSTGETISIN